MSLTFFQKGGGGSPLLAAPAYAYGLRDVVTRSRSDRSALQPLSRDRPRLTLGAYYSQTEISVARSLANNIRFGLHVIARSKTTKQSIAGSSSTPSNGRSIAAPVTPWLQMPTAPEMCSSRSHDRSGMFAQRHIFFRLRAFISGCLAALDAAPPFAVAFP